MYQMMHSCWEAPIEKKFVQSGLSSLYVNSSLSCLHEIKIMYSKSLCMYGYLCMFGLPSHVWKKLRWVNLWPSIKGTGWQGLWTWTISKLSCLLYYIQLQVQPHMLQLSRNFRDSPGFLVIVLVTRRLNYCSIIGPRWGPDSSINTSTLHCITTNNEFLVVKWTSCLW